MPLLIYVLQCSSCGAKGTTNDYANVYRCPRCNGNMTIFDVTLHENHESVDPFIDNLLQKVSQNDDTAKRILSFISDSSSVELKNALDRGYNRVVHRTTNVENASETCWVCLGSGRIQQPEEKQCPLCYGAGKIKIKNENYASRYTALSNLSIPYWIGKSIALCNSEYESILKKINSSKFEKYLFEKDASSSSTRLQAAMLMGLFVSGRSFSLPAFIGKKEHYVCPDCHGSGFILCPECGGTKKMNCPECGGLGQVRGNRSTWVKCPKCQGRKQITCNSGCTLHKDSTGRKQYIVPCPSCAGQNQEQYSVAEHCDLCFEDCHLFLRKNGTLQRTTLLPPFSVSLKQLPRVSSELKTLLEFPVKQEKVQTQASSNESNVICSGAFPQIDTLLRVEIPSSIKRIESAAFDACAKLHTVILPSQLQFIAQGAFGSVSLTNIEIPSSTVVSGDIRAWNPFYEYIKSDKAGFDKAGFEVSLNREVLLQTTCYDYRIHVIDIPKGIKRIDRGARFDINDRPWDGILHLPSTIEEFGPDISFWCMDKHDKKYHCVQHLKIESANRKINALFNSNGTILVKILDCKITSFSIPSGVKKIAKYAFSDCRMIKQVSFPAGLEIIDQYAFSDCENLSEVHLPASLDMVAWNAFPASCKIQTPLIDADGAFFSRNHKILFNFFNYKNRVSYKIPDGVQKVFALGNLPMVEIPDSLVEVGYISPKVKDAYSHFASIYRKADWPNWEDRDTLINFDIYNTHFNTTDENGAFFSKDKKILFWFANSKGLPAYEVPEGVEIIAPWAFSRAGLNQIKLPDSLKVIERCAFFQSSFETVELPDGISYIGQNAFGENNGLRSVTVRKKKSANSVSRQYPLYEIKDSQGKTFSIAIRGNGWLPVFRMVNDLLKVEENSAVSRTDAELKYLEAVRIISKNKRHASETETALLNLLASALALSPEFVEEANKNIQE